MCTFLKLGIFVGAMCVLSLSVSADEIRLKDGKKLNGVIVGYEDNMFKVKTDYGFVLVEKDKIASIVPSGGSAKSTEPVPEAKSTPAISKNGASATPELETGRESSPSKMLNAAVKPELPANSASKPVNAPALRPTASPVTSIGANAVPPAPPKDEPPAIREEILGNQYTNYTHGFRMYKAPSWALIEDARSAVPNAIVALGTSNESTLMVVGREKTKAKLADAAAVAEKRLHEVYGNYRQISERKTVVGGLPAVEYHYRGTAEDHDWSGTLVVIERNGEIFTALGMTYADNDLIQIQENVISKAIGSMNFSIR
ncbi:MAG TPA: hypothetical protein VN982_00065 [Candidatus Dormibacteraeota bacterium]|nr:hypothetical protein [Candidatus Dormibacteraeota bacterium]